MLRFFSAALLLFGSPLVMADAWEPWILRSYDGREIHAEMAMLPVRENRSQPNSRLIRVAMIRLRSHGAATTAPPIVFLSGGPGIPATALARVPVYFDLFTKLQAVGDVLLIDQRGSGMSLPNLTCPPGNVPASFLSSDDAFRDALLASVTACTRFWKAGGLDLHGYSTAEIAADVEAARKAAGARTMKLLAFSYGSEVAIEIARRRPRTVDRIVFASTRAPDTLLKLASAWDRQLATIGELSGLPLPTIVKRVVMKLDATPIIAKTANESFTVSGIGVLSILRSDLPDGRALPNVPAFVRALDAGDYDPLTPRVQQLHNSLTSLNLMTLAVDCSSGWSPRRRAAADEEARAAILRNVNLQWDESICAAILGRPGIPAPIPRRDIPALFITGTLDVNAPVAQTEHLRKSFPRSIHVIVENGAHETLPAALVQERVLRFLRGQSIDAKTVTLPTLNFR
jgi:pimeloyl-ACP methyl ester carboxylesterase